MRFLWTLVKIVVGLAIAIPLALILFGVAMGILGAMIGLAVLALKLAAIVLVGFLCLSLAMRLFRALKPSDAQRPPVRELPAPDRHYESAMRELEMELGERPLRP